MILMMKYKNKETTVKRKRQQCPRDTVTKSSQYFDFESH